MAKLSLAYEDLRDELIHGLLVVNTSVVRYDTKESSGGLAHTYFLVDIRDVQLNFSDARQTIEQKKKDAIAAFPSAFATAAATGVVTTEDSTGTYQLARRDISLIMAVSENVSYIVSPLIDTSKVRFVVAANSTLNLLLSKRSNGTSASGLLVSIHTSKGPNLRVSVLAFFILKILSLSSILLAVIIVMRNHEYLLKMVQQMRLEEVKHPVLNAVLPIVFILCSVAIILLAYFFFDIMVYVFITLFVIAGASSIAGIFCTFIFNCAPQLKNSLSISVCRKDVHLLRLGLFFLFLIFTITWCIYRNDSNILVQEAAQSGSGDRLVVLFFLLLLPSLIASFSLPFDSIGWVMQDVIGVFLVAHILADISALLSFKAITIGFLVFVCYDIFFVFITPLFTPATATTSTNLLSSNAHEILSRVPRSAESVMEAVATGSAGTSGEKMPLLFKVSTGSLLPSLENLCTRGDDFMLLGFGDSILPGTLCVFMAFYDACWKMKFPHHLFGAMAGE
ncbi:unnamed protein product [Schistocephalus solidus]|uniref:Dolichol kinase n=1 Tax=Schistocephalus solidus TaxID=70667 RepID=A0A183SRP0_SCHSO|nr:unnamed protein product [Schistocephalus solidus]